MSVKHFKPYLYGREFRLRTDHASLQWLYRRKEPAHQVARWLEILAEFKFKLEHRAGAKHDNAYGLRRSCTHCKQCHRIEERDSGPSWSELETQAITTQQLNLQDNTAQEIPELQRQTGSATARIISALETNRPIATQELEQGSTELRKLADSLDLCRLEKNLLEIRTLTNGRERWLIICPFNMRKYTPNTTPV